MALTANDILLAQVSSGGTDFTERFVGLAKGKLLSLDSSNVPVASAAPGANNEVLVADSAAASGMKWAAAPLSHTQHTDTGTTSTIFELDNDGFKIELTAESAAKFGVKVDGGATYADLQAKDITAAKVTLGADPGSAMEAATKQYVDGRLAANDAMIFKGTIGTGGTHTIAAFNSLSTYDAGWSYKVIEAGTIKGAVCEIGDMVIATADRTGTGNVNGDWVAIQTNIDGAVTGPASTTDNYVALFSGPTGKVIKAGTGALGSGAYAAAYVHPSLQHIPSAGATKQILQWSSADTAKWVDVSGDAAIADGGAVTIAPGAVTLAKMANLAANSIIGNNTGSTATPVALTGTQVINMIWQTAPATKTAAGAVGQIAKDGNYLYICTATNVWCRMAIATNW